jgi:glycosyltransferase involved in cell wall biosynthesis
MNIAFLNTTKIWGGVKTWMLEFGHELQMGGDQVHIFGKDPNFIKEAKENGCHARIASFGFNYNPSSIRNFIGIFKEHGIDVVCMNVTQELRTAGIAAMILGIPVVHRVGMTGDIADTFHHRIMQKRLVDGVLVTSQWLRQELIDNFPFIPPEKVTCIYNARRITGGPRTARHRPARFVITSRLNPGKGHEDLIRALGMLRDEGTDGFTCDIYGEGPLEEDIRRRIDEAGLEDRVLLKGFSGDLPRVLPEYDFGVLTSDWESLANVIMEYLAAALPSVVTSSSGPREMVDHGASGFLYEPGDFRALAGHLRKCAVMGDSTYSRFSQNTHRMMEEKFSMEERVRELREYFEKLIAGSRKSRR